jgi:hypothetical protein
VPTYFVDFENQLGYYLFMSYRILHPRSDIVVFCYDNPAELCISFARMQEFYESALTGINAHYFTLEDFIIRYCSAENPAMKTKKERFRFRYIEDFYAFNLYSNVIRKWLEVFGDDVSPREQLILNEIKPLLESGKDFAVLGIHEGNNLGRICYPHEIAHAFYFLDKKYKAKMDKLIADLPKKIRKACRKEIAHMGYGDNAIQDEIHAYLSTNFKHEVFDIKGLWKYSKPFRKLFWSWAKNNGVKWVHKSKDVDKAAKD